MMSVCNLKRLIYDEFSESSLTSYTDCETGGTVSKKNQNQFKNYMIIVINMLI